MKVQAKETQTVVIATPPLGLNEQNTHSESLWWLSTLSVLILGVIVLVLWAGWKRLCDRLDTPSSGSSDPTTL